MAKAESKKYEGPIAARYGDRLKQAAIDVMASPSQAGLGDEKVAEIPIRRVVADDEVPQPRPAAMAAETTSIRIIVTMGERDELDSLLHNMSKAVGARVKLANVMRACINQLLNADEHIVSRAQRAKEDFATRPANTDAFGLARFEDQIREVIEAGLMDAARRSRA